MPITLLHFSENHSLASATPGVNLVASTTAGSLMVVGYTSQRSGGIQTVSSVTDSATNTYVQATGAAATTATSLILIDFWFFPNVGAGVTSVTVTPGGGTSGADEYVGVWEVAGMATTSPQDGSGSVLSDQNSANPTGASITTTNAADFIATILNDPHGITGWNTGGFTADTIDGAGANSNGAYGHQIVASVGAYANSATSASGNWCSATVAFKAPGGGTTFVSPPPLLVRQAVNRAGTY